MPTRRQLLAYGALSLPFARLSIADAMASNFSDSGQTVRYRDLTARSPSRDLDGQYIQFRARYIGSVSDAVEASYAAAGIDPEAFYYHGHSAPNSASGSGAPPFVMVSHAGTFVISHSDVYAGDVMEARGQVTLLKRRGEHRLMVTLSCVRKVTSRGGGAKR